MPSIKEISGQDQGTGEGTATVNRNPDDVIDPTVPLQGFPPEVVKSAVWHEEEEIITSAGFERRIPKRYPKINGIVFNESTSPANWRKALEWFPKTLVMIPETDDERERRVRSGKFRASEPIIWNSVRFTMPKGVPVMVPQPIAEMVNHVAETFRTEEGERLISDLLMQANSKE